MMLYLVHHDLISQESFTHHKKREIVLPWRLPASYEMYKAKARGEAPLFCLPSQ